MDPKILRESFDRLTAIEEGDDTTERLRRHHEALQDGIEAFREIQQDMFEIIQQLKETIRQHAPDQLAYWKAYGLAHIAIIAGSDEYASSDDSLETLITNLEEDMEETKGDMRAPAKTIARKRLPKGRNREITSSGPVGNYK